WGRLNGMASLDHAMGEYQVDPTKVYVTGHSMGGHGTWHLGVMHPGRFAALGPSAGWSTIYSYGGTDRPEGAFEAARSHSDTMEYVSNLADRGVYMLHAEGDDNVPISEGERMYDAASEVTDDIEFHREDSDKHWWDGDEAEGTDCVDWPELWSFFEDRTLDPYELDFEFKSPGPYYSTEHSYVTIRSDETPYEDCVVESEETEEGQVSVTTDNVRSMDIDGDALLEKGVDEIEVDGTTHEVEEGTIEIGPREGKKPGVNGPLNQVFQRPFCFVYPKDGSPVYRRYAAYLLSQWSYLGNGHGCSLPLYEVDEEVRSERNLIYVGVDDEDIAEEAERPFAWSEDELEIGDSSYEEAAAFAVFPEDDGLSVSFMATEGDESLLYHLQPFNSRNGMPDYLVWGEGGGQAAGFFDANWEFDESLAN
ncbi:MAG: prolyl oligopeptidase family serine peptidase, partial [Persicimonas sp.]